jgi:hypothetical protein
MPPELHAEIAHRAEREHVSLNQYIVGALAGNVGRPARRGARPGPKAATARPRPTLGSSRAIGAALVLNLIVVTIAGAAAIALLVLAWTRL